MIDHTGRNLYLILIPNSVTDQNDLTQVTFVILIKYKKLWEELLTHFPLMGHGKHRQRKN
jgi:hypothetical protein